MINRCHIGREELRRIGASFEASPPEGVLRWGLAEFYPEIALACSFGAEDVVLVDMITKIRPDTTIFYLDTDLLFPETYAVRDQLIARYAIKPIAYTAALSLDQQSARYGDHLYARQPDLCCQIRKVEPLKRALEDLQAWITGIRREQSPTRANAGLIEWDEKFSLVKINPLAAWTARQVRDYINTHKLPYNVLHDRNYPSIGCAPCTRPVKPGEDLRAGRWDGFTKTECGLHG